MIVWTAQEIFAQDRSHALPYLHIHELSICVVGVQPPLRRVREEFCIKGDLPVAHLLKRVAVDHQVECPKPCDPFDEEIRNKKIPIFFQRTGARLVAWIPDVYLFGIGMECDENAGPK